MFSDDSWIEDLALEELRMDESGVVDYFGHIDPATVIEESSIDFMNQLREKFEFFINIFNQARGNNYQIKIFKISNTVNDFMLFRNSLRLIFTRKSSDLVTIGFLSGNGELIPIKISRMLPEQAAPSEIRAHVGPFNKVTWQFAGEQIDLDALVKFYLSEFIRNSAK